jgi:hypothetical protein
LGPTAATTKAKVRAIAVIESFMMTLEKKCEEGLMFITFYKIVDEFTTFIYNLYKLLFYTLKSFYYLFLIPSIMKYTSFLCAALGRESASTISSPLIVDHEDVHHVESVVIDPPVDDNHFAHQLSCAMKRVQMLILI